FLPNAGAERGDERADFFVAQHLVEPGLLHVQDLAAQGQDGLVATVASLFGRPAGGIALDQEEFAARGVLLLAVRQLPGQAARVESPFAARQLTRLARRLPRPSGVNRLGTDLPPDRGVFLELLHQLLVDEARHRALDVAIQFSLGLALELR